MEIILTLLYATFTACYNIFKKLAVRKSVETTILAIFTTTAFLLSCIWIPFGIGVSWEFVLILAFKGFTLAISWYLILKVLKTADLSLVTITNVISTVITFILGIIIFKESAGILQIIGSVIVVVGVALINLTNRNQTNKITHIQLVMLLISAIIATTSSLIDKYTTTYLTSMQVQFWFLFFVCLFSWVFFLIECVKSKKFLIQKVDFKNYWIYLMGIGLFVADVMLFRAYKVPGSQLITISVISKLKAVITVVAGIFIFKEKNILKKIIFSLIVVLGVILISIKL